MLKLGALEVFLLFSFASVVVVPSTILLAEEENSEEDEKTRMAIKISKLHNLLLKEIV